MGGDYGVGKHQYKYHRQPRANTNAIVSQEHMMSSSKARVGGTKRWIKWCRPRHRHCTSNQATTASITTFHKVCEGKMILSPISWLFIVIRTPPMIIWEGGISKFYDCLTSFSQEQFCTYFERQTQQTSPLSSIFGAHLFPFRRKGTPSP